MIYIVNIFHACFVCDWWYIFNYFVMHLYYILFCMMLALLFWYFFTNEFILVTFRVATADHSDPMTWYYIRTLRNSGHSLQCYFFTYIFFLPAYNMAYIFLVFCPLHCFSSYGDGVMNKQLRQFLTTQNQACYN